MAGEDTVWFEFVESKVFYRQVRDLSANLLTVIQADLIGNPERGDLVEGTGGARKARVAAPAGGRGKSGSYRYLYLYLPRVGRIHLLYTVRERRAGKLVACAEEGSEGTHRPN